MQGVRIKPKTGEPGSRRSTTRAGSVRPPTTEWLGVHDFGKEPNRRWVRDSYFWPEPPRIIGAAYIYRTIQCEASVLCTGASPTTSLLRSRGSFHLPEPSSLLHAALYGSRDPSEGRERSREEQGNTAESRKRAFTPLKPAKLRYIRPWHRELHSNGNHSTIGVPHRSRLSSMICRRSKGRVRMGIRDLEIDGKEMFSEGLGCPEVMP
ncbi:hypothetical protein VNO77_27731 [Canavalia gladiata]|uniref:Uncharacterized protein n=1 Tax=Canavalia gladiata TaxID=3824 RepID=A0AAN9KUN6_CANGL